MIKDIRIAQRYRTVLKKDEATDKILIGKELTAYTIEVKRLIAGTDHVSDWEPIEITEIPEREEEDDGKS
jgi:hypothetical protein